MGIIIHGAIFYEEPGSPAQIEVYELLGPSPSDNLFELRFIYFISLILMIVGILFLILIQYLDRCKSHCSLSCQNVCFNVKELTYLDVNKMDKELTIQDVQPVQSKILSLDILLLICGILEISIGVAFSLWISSIDMSW